MLYITLKIYHPEWTASIHSCKSDNSSFNSCKWLCSHVLVIPVVLNHGHPLLNLRHCKIESFLSHCNWFSDKKIQCLKPKSNETESCPDVSKTSDQDVDTVKPWIFACPLFHNCLQCKQNRKIKQHVYWYYLLLVFCTGNEILGLAHC